MNIGPYSDAKILPEKNIIITTQHTNTLTILEFDGQVKDIYTIGNGNTNFDVSNDQEQIICFFYSTKSQFFNINSKKKDVLWAHPTFIKDYKETLYNDIHHNFGMAVAKFSPDDTYIVGGAEHGKYVA